MTGDIRMRASSYTLSFLQPGYSGSITESEVRCGDPAFRVVLAKLAIQVLPEAQTEFPQISLEGTAPGGFEFCHRVRYPGVQPYSVEVPKLHQRMLTFSGMDCPPDDGGRGTVPVDVEPQPDGARLAKQAKIGPRHGVLRGWPCGT